MSERSTIISEKLALPVAIISIVTGLISIYKETPWYVYSFLFLLTLGALLYLFLRSSTKYDFTYLVSEEIIDIQDQEGKIAFYRNETQLKATKNNVQEAKYNFFCDGEINNVKVTQGRVEKVFKEINDTNIYTLLPKPLKKEEVFKHILSFNLNNCFISENEYWSTTKYIPSEIIVITICFPHGRLFSHYKSVKISGFKTTITETQPILTTVNGKTALVLKLKNIRPLETYRIEWSW